ncbi:hypothetical protein K2173_008992 [Erythroxylum novogranatense]|uniref:Uncharacterized protein n=1 Tax=Erythroxylum novogranatense TaxID=1862640 RepID=A0AAV8TUK5_9ROSI|nr:hypothetical protein K2173_008992 [Erythroxylum novogranatense]
MEKKGILQNLMKLRTSNENSFKSLLFQRMKRSLSPSSSSHEDPSSSSSPSYSSPFDSPKPIPQLSPLANSVVHRCSKILQLPAQELQHRFDIELPESVKQLFTYARNFVEFCSYQALQVSTNLPDYLADPEFRRLTYDMMLAWEAPSAEIETQRHETNTSINEEQDGENNDEDGWSLFYSSSTKMALQVDDTKTVGREAFARIAPVCPAIADVIAVHNLFDALASSSGHRLHFLIYDKYLRSLDKIYKTRKSISGPFISNIQLQEGEIIIDVDGAIPTQPVLQHIGMLVWPGRLTLTNYALYFESLGVGSYDKAVRYDLSKDMKQVVKPELTGPLGARLFDKALMYKSASVVEPVYFEFPEFKSNSRRDYWLDICLEILHAHKFTRKNNFSQIQESEILARAILAIHRYHAIREAFHFFSSQYKTLLAFTLAESHPRGDVISETLSSRLALLKTVIGPQCPEGPVHVKRQLMYSPIAFLALRQLGFNLQKDVNIVNVEVVGDLCAGETSPLEMAVKQSISDSRRAQAAQATVNQVKVEGIDTNFVVMKELLLPVIELARRLEVLASWKAPLKSTIFLVVSCYAILRGWTRFFLPCILMWYAIMMLFRRHLSKGKPLEPFKVRTCLHKNAVEQLFTLQEAITRAEAFIQAGNIILLKIRALLFAVLPQATERVALLLVLIAAVFAFVPLKHLMLLGFLEAFTRDMPYRKESSDRLIRRLREWWVKIPAAPVQLVKLDNKKKKK